MPRTQKGETHAWGSGILWICPRCSKPVISSKTELGRKIAEHSRTCPEGEE